MALTPGTLLGPYEVLAPLGAGGMGEVYRARDTRLGRDVAVKVLPAGTANDPAAAARFDREARAIAAINHPSICALYDVGHDAGRTYLVMELLEGETLQQRLSRGPLQTGLLIDLSIALADGLDAAHARGLIHRDLKPANLFLTRHGHVKILDFGLAKAIDAPEPDEETRVADNALTSPGSAVGTVAYMSPEQLRGDAVDARSDLFSFGVVLYEIATGRRAFLGNTTGAISAAILRDEPPAPRSLSAELPAKFEEVILKAIEKDRDLRYQTAAELRTDLKRLKRASSSDATTPVSADAASRAIAPASDSRIAIGMVKRHRFKVAVASTMAIAVIAAVTGWLTRDRAGQSKEAAAGAIEIQPLTVVGDACCAGISPDGAFVAFVRNRNGASSVWVRQISSGSAVEIVPPTPRRDIRTVSVTPDGGFVDFTMRDAADADFDLWRAPFLGGQARPMIRNVWSGVGWSPDGRHVAFIRRAADRGMSWVIVANGDGSGERIVATRKNPAEFVNVSFRVQPIARPAWSTDSRTLYVIGVMRTPERAKNAYEIVALDAETGTERRVLPLDGGAFDLARLDDARLIVNRGSLFGNPQFMLWNEDASDMVPMLNDLASFYGVSLTADRTRGVSQRTEERTGIWLGASTGDSMMQVVEDSAAQPAIAAVDNDGAVYYGASLPDGHSAVYRMRPGAGSEPTLVVDPGANPRLSPDGRTIALVRARPTPAILRVSIDGTGLETLFDEFPATSPAVSPDGTTLYFTSTRGGAYTLWSMPVRGGTPRQLGHTGMDVRFAISPDGRTGVFIDAARTVMLCDLPECTNARPSRTDAWGTFTPDGRGLAFMPRTDPKNVWIQPFGAAARALTHFTDKYVVNDFSFSRDGRRLVVTRLVTTSDIVMIKGLR